MLFFEKREIPVCIPKRSVSLPHAATPVLRHPCVDGELCAYRGYALTQSHQNFAHTAPSYIAHAEK